MPVQANRQELRERNARAQEFLEFRKRFLFSQRDLAEALTCSLRTVASIERGEVTTPHPRWLRKFRTLKHRCERLELEAAQRAQALAAMPVAGERLSA
jgi:DNA-binding XRE family transcriptional regulator